MELINLLKTIKKHGENRYAKKHILAEVCFGGCEVLKN